MQNQMYNAKLLLSIANFWGEDITPEQAVWLDTEVNCLPRNEQEKFLARTSRLVRYGSKLPAKKRAGKVS
jgi:hypothetical protein